MLGNKTLAIIKPDAVEKGYTGKIISMIIEAGFKVKGMKMIGLTKSSAEGFYAIHKERPFFNELVKYMSSGPCIPIALEKENAVVDLLKFLGFSKVEKIKPNQKRLEKRYYTGSRVTFLAVRR